MISPYILLALGFLSILSELMLGSFYLLFCGIAFLIVASIGFFVDLLWYFQILLVAIISVFLIFALKKPFKNTIHNKDEFKEDFLNDSGDGVFKDGMVYYKGTLWHFDDKFRQIYKDGDFVKICGTKGNKVIIQE